MDITNFGVIEGIKKYREEVDTSFHMPGHKNKPNILDEIGNNLYKYDITETIGTDNLHFPTGMIKNTLDFISDSYKTKQSYIVVNGTSCGVISSIMACTNPGDFILVQRDCHKSVYNAVILGGLKVEYLYPEFNKEHGLNFSVSLEKLEQMLINYPKIKLVVLTYPTFYGICFDIKKAAEIVHKYGKILMIDEAHGSHLNFSEMLPQSAESSGADIVTQSTHKTLPSLTQSSVLHVCSDRIDTSKLSRMLRMLQTTSPSYILMASVQNAIEYMNKNGEEKLQKNIEMFRIKTNELRELGVNVLTDDFLISEGCYEFDETRAVVSLNDVGITGKELEIILREKYKIQMEMSDLMYIVGYITAADDPSDIAKLFDAIKEIYIDAKKMGNKSSKVYIEEFPRLTQEMSMKNAFYSKNEIVTTEKSIGRISSDFIIPYPPGIPLICPGEIIKEETIEYATSLLANGINVNGIENNLLRVVVK
ncbi:aminotransferase class I/II-fold pyridoxal phosphate-dependent enzyme [Sedimentibacter sp. zth1]|uniref:aminotransferase class I/II-fold pyridoxal phosphate-dependent enzyme n=1 Tax=Sedimentibacter sp. zth1 TaxID=2816908 RepID=UPI001A93422E|nr:aminotransferase class I/II-fold pyridoxal phosphate-dependent enzyme [Sedimentibacter sp. zth1]QSX04931.1 aminotransferase class I/II-fold pyridoxal phosphate-dependent enzyme [Sedimentibacter sp. zth1]